MRKIAFIGISLGLLILIIQSPVSANLEHLPMQARQTGRTSNIEPLCAASIKHDKFLKLLEHQDRLAKPERKLRRIHAFYDLSG